MNGTATRATAFADLVLADPAWLDAEFAAIVDANFGATPEPPFTRRGPSGNPGATDPPAPPRPHQRPVPHRVHPHQRSPPDRRDVPLRSSRGGVVRASRRPDDPRSHLGGPPPRSR
ncbi:hypothetical protein [Saccharothrix longispora]|uniref:hypothetical protein n=1 Tax=Saccharothrix longispora TaxID=33920 RepID=UPI0031EBD764